MERVRGRVCECKCKERLRPVGFHVIWRAMNWVDPWPWQLLSTASCTHVTRAAIPFCMGHTVEASINTVRFIADQAHCIACVNLCSATYEFQIHLGPALIDRCRCVQVITFDELGVSGHPNHISTHYGVRRWHKKTQHTCRLCFLVGITLAARSHDWIHAKRCRALSAREQRMSCIRVGCWTACNLNCSLAEDGSTSL